MYDQRLGRWHATDPYEQHWSPYLAMSNNPVSFVDPDGGWDSTDSDGLYYGFGDKTNLAVVGITATRIEKWVRPFFLYGGSGRPASAYELPEIASMGYVGLDFRQALSSSLDVVRSELAASGAEKPDDEFLYNWRTGTYTWLSNKGGNDRDYFHVRGANSVVDKGFFDQPDNKFRTPFGTDYYLDNPFGADSKLESPIILYGSWLVTGSERIAPGQWEPTTQFLMASGRMEPVIVEDMMVPALGAGFRLLRGSYFLARTAGKGAVYGAAKGGINITYLTKAGKYPSWITVKSRYWNIMNGGKVPSGTALVRVRATGKIETINVSKELHHINGRTGADPHRFSNLKEVWPWEHQAIDPSRHTGYDFIQWVK